ncbi:DUF4188 domain-containing protein [Paraliomyxa miuraensis]|uniref:DUF4188 domain-containing protein n=1 Tax=Paraliomyxa miuraensis TaxID=376150 RepID=UPI00224D47AB|nr:DUF4188 domain-containing protein [Paraliomyxa miuraensis]MCX4239672.1 DUF4188 domain-containing protein [Paraliomyxa miuraensis]
MQIHDQRLTVQRDEGFVVFLIGARINKWWLLPVAWAVGRAFGRMLAELQADPDSGLLSFESYVGRTTLTLQYWRSLEDLQRYAHARERAHVPAWRRWIKEWGLRAAVGIWHETYVVEPGTYECFYQHMPAFGLGRVGPLVPAKGELSSARGRIAAGRRSAVVDAA